MSTAAQEAIQFVLQTNIMFSVLPQQEKGALHPLFELRQFKEGDVIARQGTPADGMYFFYSGRSRVKMVVSGRIGAVGMVEPEEVRGEMSLLGDFVWKQDIVAIEPVVCLVLPAKATRALLPSHPVIEQHFRAHVGLIEISDHLKSFLGRASYTRQQMNDILVNLGVKRIKPGNYIFNQGDNDPRLYFIEMGVAELTRSPIGGTGEAVILDRVARGGFIGETAAVSGFDKQEGTHTHSARAIDDVTVLVVQQAAVRQIFDIQPELLERLRDRVADLKRFEQEEIEVRHRAEGVDQRIKLASGVTEAEFRKLDTTAEIIKFPDVRQSKESQCAAACLTMVTMHHGKKIPLGQIRELTALDGDELTPDDIIRGAEQLGFRAKGYALTYDDLKNVKLPGIAGWQGYHYVVVFRVTDREVHISDPNGGIQKLKRDDFFASWSAAKVAGVTEIAHDRGVFIGLEPTQAFELEKEPENPYRHFINYLLPYKTYFGEAILAALVINLLGIASPLFIQTIVDTVVVHQDVALLNMMLAGMVLVTFLSIMTSSVQSMLLAHTTARIDMRMMSEFYRHILSLPMSFFLTRNKGEILARFGENQKIRAIIAGSSITVLLNAMMIVLYFLMMFAYSFKLTIIVMVFLPVYIAIVLYFTPRIKKLAQESFVTSSQAQSYLIESLNGIEALKATANEYFARARWEDAFAENVNRGFLQQKLALTSQGLFRLATTAMSIVVLWLGASTVMSGAMTVGELMGFNMLMGLVTAPVLAMVNLWNDMQEIRIAVDRVGDVLCVKPEQVPSVVTAHAQVGAMEGLLDFRKVNFGYSTSEGSKLIMQDFDLVIRPGEKVGFVGPSGCGKSTIAKMVLGFNRPQGGELLVDGKNILDIDIYSLRRNIGMVLQDSFVFSGTVAENIALGDPDPDMQAVREASRLAGADEFIVNYPQGYNTRIGEKGIGISGGQRQRICIARSLYHKPKVMIFDEATSALDNESEERITQALRTILRGRTSITIAHRLSTVIDSDTICYIKDGKVQEKGCHKDLVNVEYLREMGYSGLYYGLARTQFDLPPLELGNAKGV